MMDFGECLRDWRQSRRLSQLALASNAGISARHLSFLETGRSQPSRGMILRISQALELPASGRNELLALARFAPVPQSAAPGAGRDGEAFSVVELILDRHSPWPAVCLDAAYNIVKPNSGFARLAAAFDLAPGSDFVSQIFTNGSLREAIMNWDDFARAFTRRLRSEARFLGPRSELARTLAALESMGLIESQSERQAHDGPIAPYIPVSLELGGLITSWITTITTIGSAQDAFLEGLFIEQYFPADDTTRQLADAMASGPS